MIRIAAALFAVLILAVVPAVGQETITYRHGDYTAEVPAHPQRVFVMDSRTALDFAVSAGLPIVATDWDADVGSHFETALPVSSDRIAFRNEPNAELVLSYEPDLLVVGAGWWRFWQEKAMFKTGTVPVLVIEDGNNANWKQLMVDQLTAYGRADRAAALMAEYDAAVVAAKPKIAAALHGRKVAVADIWGPDSVVLQVDTFSTAVARDLGIDLVTAEGVEPTEDGYQVLSPENLGAFEDAALVMSLWTLGHRRQSAMAEDPCDRSRRPV